MIDKDMLANLMMPVIINIACIAGGSAASLAVSKRSRLEKKGYPEPFIQYQSAFTRKFGWQFFLFLFLAQVGFALLALYRKGDLFGMGYLERVFIPAMMLSLLFAIFKSSEQGKAYEMLTKEHNLERAVDFGFIKLKMMFCLNLEIPAGLLVFAYLLLNHNWGESMIIVLYVAILWFFAATVRLSRNAPRAVMEDQYLLMGKMMLIYQALLVFLLLLPLGLEKWSETGLAGHIMLLTVSTGLTAKWIYYLRVYPRFARAVESIVRPDLAAHPESQ